MAVSSLVAASRAFTAADELQRDTDEERYSSQAGMALVGLAIVEVLIALVALFVWAVSW